MADSLSRRPWGAWRRDATGTSAMALLFSVALGNSGLLLPLVALAEGSSAAQVGLLYSFSAVTQIFTRLTIGSVLRRISDRAIVAIAAITLMASFLVVLISPNAALLALAWAMQGFARAFFFTGSQTHVVRGPGTAMGAVAKLNFFCSIGLLVGPVVAGALAEVGAQAALVIGATLSGVALGPIFIMDRYAPFARSAGRSRTMWRHPGVDAACGASMAAGAWRGLLDSMVPAVLDGARQSAPTIGVLIGAANAAGVVGTVAIGGLTARRTGLIYVLSMFSTAAGMALLGFAAGNAFSAALVMVLAGLGSGALQTLAPALAATSVAPAEQGDAIAAAGVARTIAMSGTPLMVSAALLLIAPTPALLVIGAAYAVPAVAARSLRGGPRTS